MPRRQSSSTWEGSFFPHRSRQPKVRTLREKVELTRNEISSEWEAENGFEAGSMFAAIKHNSHTGAWARLERGELSLEEFYEPFASEVSAMRGAGDKVNYLIITERPRDNPF